jgi:hypothetical protein
MTSVRRLANSSNSSLVRGRKVERSFSLEPLGAVRGLAAERRSVAARTSASNSAFRSRSLRALGSSTSLKSTS